MNKGSCLSGHVKSCYSWCCTNTVNKVSENVVIKKKIHFSSCGWKKKENLISFCCIWRYVRSRKCIIWDIGKAVYPCWVTSSWKSWRNSNNWSTCGLLIKTHSISSEGEIHWPFKHKPRIGWKHSIYGWNHLVIIKQNLSIFYWSWSGAYRNWVKNNSCFVKIKVGVSNLKLKRIGRENKCTKFFKSEVSDFNLFVLKINCIDESAGISRGRTFFNS